MGERSDRPGRVHVDAAEMISSITDDLKPNAKETFFFNTSDVLPTEFRPEIAACALVDAIYNGMSAAAQQWNVPMDVLLEWRRRLKTGKLSEDAELRRMFAEKREEMRASWAEDAADTLIAANAFVRRAAQSNLLIPDMVAAVAAAAAHIKGALTRDRMIDANYPPARPIAGILADSERSGEVGNSPEEQ